MLGACVAGAMAMLVPAGGKLPAPLSPADGPHTFTYDSVQRRLPLIVEAVGRCTNKRSHSTGQTLLFFVKPDSGSRVDVSCARFRSLTTTPPTSRAW